MAAREIEQVVISNIVVGDRRRHVTEADVVALAESMTALGLLNPILIRYADEVVLPDGVVLANAPVLIAGETRLRAAKLLGWQKIDAVCADVDDIHAAMIEIAENLHRTDLSALERSEQIAEWLRLAEEKTRQVDAISPAVGRGNTGGRRAAAREIGVSDPGARRAEKVASLSPEAKQAARDAGLDNNQSALLSAASRETPDAQVAELRRKADERAARKAREHGEVRDAKGDAREVLAQAIADFIPEAKLSDIGAALALLGLKEVASRVQALTGSVFDKGEFGKAA